MAGDCDDGADHNGGSDLGSSHWQRVNSTGDGRDTLDCLKIERQVIIKL